MVDKDLEKILDYMRKLLIKKTKEVFLDSVNKSMSDEEAENMIVNVADLIQIKRKLE